jgi:hypothetical protein
LTRKEKPRHQSLATFVEVDYRNDNQEMTVSLRQMPVSFGIEIAEKR